MKKIISLDKGWKFKKESDIFSSELKDYFNMFESNTKTGMSSDARGNSFFDNDWDNVDLPDDWNTRENADIEFEDRCHGHKPKGAVWYRKSFKLKHFIEGKRIFLKFDAIAINSEIWFNSIKIAQSESGYTPIYVEVTDFIKPDRQNCISVRCANSVKEGWWYEGGGIYGNTYLIIADKAMLSEYGTFIRSKKLCDNKWQLSIDIEAEIPDNDCSIEISSGELNINKTIHANSKNAIEVNVDAPECWDINNPKLYEITIKLICGNKITDIKKIKHGFRTIRFDSDNGFFLNDKHIKLNGVCIHHDFACVGIAVPYEIQLYRIQRLKEMGCNAIRTSHNPQLEGFYRACDELGILVMNEARHFSSTAECLNQLKTFILRDRNHPCVILWSIFNEEPLQCTTVGRKMAKTMKNTVNALDGTRPISGGMNGPMEIEGVIKELDVIGFNYVQYEYDEFHAIYPNLPIIGSETASYLTTRDTVSNKPPYLASFGNTLYENLHKWSSNIGETWKCINDRNFVCGGFDWTGFDYRGESGDFPACVCNFGAMDLCGFPKGSFYWHKVIWDSSPQVYLSPYWEYEEGQTVSIACYSNCDYIEIYLNNTLVHSAEHDKYNMDIINIAYVPGELKAIGYINGKIAANHLLNTPSEKRMIVCEPVNGSLVNVYLTDENRNIIHNSSDEIKFNVTGGKIIGVGNGDICNCNAEQTDRVRLFHGCAQLAVCGSDTVEITAATGNIKGTCTVHPSADPDLEYVLNEPSEIDVAPWRQSDVQSAYIEKEFIADLMFAWIPTTVGYGKNLLYSGKTGYAEICGQFNITDNMKGCNLYIIFEEIQGDADIYFNKDFIGAFKNEKDVRIPIDTNRYCGSVTVSVILKLTGGDCGLTGNVYVAESD